jgi:hypothetical protein
MITNGVRGFDLSYDDVISPRNLPAYGIDYEALRDRVLTQAHDARAVRAAADDHAELRDNPNPRQNWPSQFVEVRVDPPRLPPEFSLGDIERMEQYIAEGANRSSRDMNVRRLWWIRALEFLTNHV